jgi:predicted RNA binding protein YcfA (HicA-like mRNA interferase family)
MPKLPRPTGAEMIRFLAWQGYRVARIRGSHHVLVKEALRTTVPVHGASTLRAGTLRGILRDVEITPAEFCLLWEQQ